MVGTMPREALGQQGRLSVPHAVLAVVAEPDVVSLPAFMPAAMSLEASGGLNRLTTGLVVVGHDAQSSRSITPPRR